MLRVGFISAWHVHTSAYADEIAKRSDAVITAFWDEIPERGKEFAQRYGVRFIEDLNEFLSGTDMDAVVINAPTNMHKELMLAACNAKKHIFTEKVLALTNADAMEIKTAVIESGIKFCISFPHRTRPANIYAKMVARDKLIGDITMMRVRNSHNGATKNWLPAHFYNEDQCGGGAMIDLGAHPMYLIRWIMGRPSEITSIFTDYTGHGVEDNAVSVMKFENGAIAISETGFVSEVNPFSLELYGTEGTLLVGGYDNSVKINSNKIGSKTNGWLIPNLPEPSESAISQWIKAIAANGDITFSIDDAVALTEVMDAAYRSFRQGITAKL